MMAECGGLNDHGPRRLIDLNTQSFGSDTLTGMRRCSLGGVSRCGLVGEGIYLGFFFGDLNDQDSPPSLTLFPPLPPACMYMYLDVDLSATSPTSYLSACCHASCHDKNMLNF